jgi:NAD(P)-dependent dehydrogenase (short-subunit alcohol dehydrogenase family)
LTVLNEKVCVVTGATRGIGRPTALALAKMGATVVVHGRNSIAVNSVCQQISQATGNQSVSGVVGRFDSLAEVRQVAAAILGRHERIDVLINNAGTSSGKRRDTADGFEWQIGVNHLAPFLLTNLLLDHIKKAAPSRIVTIASAAHRNGMLEFEDLDWRLRRYSSLSAYADSKLANILFTRELARRLEGSGVTANCLHPGLVATNIFASLGLIGKLFGILSRPLLMSPAKGAETSIYLASSPEVASVSGRYFDKCRAVQPSQPATDAAAATRLWDLSAGLVSLPA